MVLTAAQTTAFFESPDQMGIPHTTMVQMQQEGIQLVADLTDFEKTISPAACRHLEEAWRKNS